MTRGRVIALILCAAVLCFAAPGWTFAVDAAGDVAASIARLSSASRAERIEAERSLAEGDLSLLKRLPQRDGIADPAVRLAVDRIRARLLERRALLDAEPTTIEASSIDTVGDFAARVPNAVVVTKRQATRHVQLPAGTATLWEATDAVASQLELWPEISDRIHFRDRTPRDGNIAIGYGGPFRLTAGPVKLKSIAGSEAARLARLTLSVQAEPKLRPLFLSYAGHKITLSANGEDLPPYSPRAQVELPFGQDEHAASFALDYVATGAVRPPLRLTGRAIVTVAAGRERFTFPLADAATVTRQQAGVTVELHSLEATPQGHVAADLSVVYETGGPAFESYRTWVYHNEAYLTYRSAGSAQQRVQRIDHEPGFSTLATSKGGVRLAYSFAGLPADAQEIAFHYEAPTKIVDVPVEFDMRGLKLEATAAD